VLLKHIDISLMKWRKMIDTKGNLLIIDDEIEVLNTLKRVFEKDYELYITQTAKEAFEIMKKFDIGVVLSDHRMPEMNGTEFLVKVRELYPDTIRILITGYSEINDLIISVNKGRIFSYVTKPWNLGDLKNTIKEAFDENALIRENTSLLEALKKSNQHLKLEIEERKKIEEKALRLASIVEWTEDGIIGMTLDGIILDWNRGAACIYGYDEAEILGESIIKLIPEDKHNEFQEMLINISQGMPMTYYETIRQRKDGQAINVYLTVSPIKDHAGEVIGASAIVNDVTAQKKLEREMVRMDQMTLVREMAASIGHEVRNPMTTVRGFLQLFGEHKHPAKYSEYIPLMISELDQANSIITQFLSISQTKKVELAQQNLNDIIEHILPLVQVDAINEEKLIKLNLDTIPDLLLNHKEIRQVILNLAKNGLEAMDKGGCLTIKTSLVDKEVILAVQDEGKGINPEIMERLGTPFITTKEMGTGLGLAVCFGIAARHNATVIAQTSPQGSTFFVKFKLADAKAVVQ